MSGSDPANAACPSSGRALALSALESSSEYLPRVSQAVERTAGLFRSGRIEEGNEAYAQVLDAFGVVVFALVAAGQQLGSVAAPLAPVEGEADAQVRSLLVAQEQRDWVRVADGLEYEVQPLLARWDGWIREVRQGAGGGDHDEAC